MIVIESIDCDEIPDSTLLITRPNSDFMPPQLSCLLYYFTAVPMNNCDSGPSDIILQFCCLVLWIKACLCRTCFSNYIKSAPSISDIHTIKQFRTVVLFIVPDA